MAEDLFDKLLAQQPATKADLMSVTIQTAAALKQIEVIISALETNQPQHLPDARKKINHCVEKLLETFEKLRKS